MPLIVRLTVPVGVPAVVVTVSVEVVKPFAGGVTDDGANVHVVFAGQLATVSPTGLLNPDVEVTVIVEVPEPPCVSVNEAGLADIEKSGVGEPQPANLNDPIRVYHA